MASPFIKRGEVAVMIRRDLTELQLRHQKEMKEKRDALKERKARAHRLIVRGAIAEKAIDGAVEMTDEEFQRALYEAIDKDERE